MIWFPKASIILGCHFFNLGLEHEDIHLHFLRKGQITPKSNEFSTLCYFNRPFMGIPSFIKQYSQIFCVAKGDCCRNLSNTGTMCSHVLPSCLVPKFHGALNTGKPNRYFLRDLDPHFKLRSPKASTMQVRVWVGVKFHCWWSFDRTFWGKDRKMIGVDTSQQPFLLQ